MEVKEANFTWSKDATSLSKYVMYYLSYNIHTIALGEI